MITLLIVLIDHFHYINVDYQFQASIQIKIIFLINEKLNNTLFNS